MKKKPLVMITILFSTCLFTFACRGQMSNPLKDKPKVSESYLGLAKNYNSVIIAQTASDNAKIKGFRLLKPDWKESWMLDSPEGFKLMIVPTIENRVNAPSIEIRRVYVFTFLDDAVGGSNILELIGINYSVNKNLDFLLANYRRNEIKGFNGAIVEYDLVYRWTRGNSFLDGKREQDTVSFSKMINKGDPGKKTGLYLKSIPSTGSGKGNQAKIRFLGTMNGKSGRSGHGNEGSGDTGYGGNTDRPFDPGASAPEVKVFLRGTVRP